MRARLVNYFQLILLAISMVGVAGCSGVIPDVKSTEGIAERLASMGGQFSLDAHTRKYRYSDKKKMNEIVTSSPDQVGVLKVLVSCMDDSSPTMTRMDGKPISLGVLCNQAVRYIATYEHTDQQGDIINWPGYVEPDASLDDLRMAKKSWEKVLKDKAYYFQ